MSLSINGRNCANIHFTGIFGSGMSALAQFVRWEGIEVSGSDRLLTNEDSDRVHSHLAAIGCHIVEQNGSGITPGTDTVCVSTAIEETNPDIVTARSHALPVVHRSDVLASIVASRRTVAVAGTSGKSTVTAMIFEFLTRCGRSPSLISGANLRSLERQGLIGNAAKGESDLLVIEADESDGTLVKYHPAISVFLNVSKDHKPVDETISFFATLAAQSRITIRNGDDRLLDGIGAKKTFGFEMSTDFHSDKTVSEALNSTITVSGVRIHIPLPGVYNIANCMAALCVCKELGCSLEDLAAAVETYEGVARRFEITSTLKGVTVVDDFAHNPEKIKAAITAARRLSQRITAIYQPHGFGPTRFLKNEYARIFSQVLTKGDSLYLLPIYYAGGTAQKDISSGDLLTLMGTTPFSARAATDREEVLDCIRRNMQAGDCVLLMGARDPSLSSFARRIVDCLGGPEPKTE